MNLSRKQINYFTCFLLILLLILIVICRKQFSDPVQMYVSLIIILLIIISCLMDNYFDIVKTINEYFNLSGKENFQNLNFTSKIDFGIKL